MEEFDARLKRCLREAITQVEAEKARDEEFRSGWCDARLRVVLPILAKAGETMSRERGFGTGRPFEEDDRVALEVYLGSTTSAPDYSVEFEPRPADRKIVRKFGGNIQGKEFYDLDKLKQEAVEEAVVCFIRAIRDHQIANRHR